MRLPLRPPLSNTPLPGPRALLYQTFYCRVTRIPSGLRFGAVHSLPNCQYLRHETKGSFVHELRNGNPALAYLPNCKWCVENDIIRGPQFKEDMDEENEI